MFVSVALATLQIIRCYSFRCVHAHIDSQRLALLLRVCCTQCTLLCMSFALNVNVSPSYAVPFTFVKILVASYLKHFLVWTTYSLNIENLAIKHFTGRTRAPYSYLRHNVPSFFFYFRVENRIQRVNTWSQWAAMNDFCELEIFRVARTNAAMRCKASK